MTEMIQENDYGKEIVITLPHGGTLRCGEDETVEWGGYLRICDAEGHEIVYWDKQEWQDEPAVVIGAIFAAAATPSTDLITQLQRTRLVDGHWE